MRHLSSIFCCLAGLAALTARADDAWAPGCLVQGVPYQSVEELRSFYKFSPTDKASRKGAQAMSLGDVSLELGPGLREMSIAGIRLVLAHPLMRDASGHLLISREDWVKWVDPILRPTYIPDRCAVRTVVLDPGHGGHDSGTPSDHLRESDTTLQIALALQAELEKIGYNVLLTRTGDYFVSDQQRVDTANAAKDAIFLSLHLNRGRSDYHGTQVYTAAPADPGSSPTPGNAHDATQAALAYALQSALVSTAGATDGGCRRAHYSLLNSITCPAAWVELGFATHEQESASLATPAYRDTLVKALARGITTYAAVAHPEARIPVQALPPKTQATTSGNNTSRTTGSSTSRTTGSTSRTTGSSTSRTTGSNTSRTTGSNTSRTTGSSTSRTTGSTSRTTGNTSRSTGNGSRTTTPARRNTTPTRGRTR